MNDHQTIALKLKDLESLPHRERCIKAFSKMAAMIMAGGIKPSDMEARCGAKAYRFLTDGADVIDIEARDIKIVFDGSVHERAFEFLDLRGREGANDA